MQSRKTSVQILPSTTAPEGSVVDKWTQSLGIEECAYATNGNATERSADNHKSDAADGELLRKITGCRFY